MKKSVITSALLASMLFATPSMANVEIEWEGYEDYSDIRPSNESRKRFAKSTFKKLEKYMVELMEDMPEGQTLSMTVTDLDLAGRVQPGNSPIFVRGGFINGFGNTAFGREIRVIDGVDIPRIDFQFELVDENGKVLLSGDKELKDLGFLQNAINFRRTDRLKYEKHMLKEWFNQEFKELRKAEQA
jgi:hypothetical protein